MRSPVVLAHYDFEPRAADFLEMLRDLGHLDDAAFEALTTAVVQAPRQGKVVTFEEVRRIAAIHLFENESRLKPEQKDVLTQEWARIFS